MSDERARLRRSVRNFKRLLSLEPGHIGHLEQLARLSVQLGRPKEAAKYLGDRAEQLERLGQPTAAIEDAANALRLRPRHKPALRLLNRLGHRVETPRAEVPQRTEVDHEAFSSPGPLDRDPTPPPTTSLAELEAEALLVAPDPLVAVPESLRVVDASDLLVVRDDLVESLDEDPEASRATRPMPVIKVDAGARPRIHGPDTASSVSTAEGGAADALTWSSSMGEMSVPMSLPSIELDTAELADVEYMEEEDEDEDEVVVAGPSSLRTLDLPPSADGLSEDESPESLHVAVPMELLSTEEQALLESTGERCTYEAGERVAIAAARFDGLRLITRGRVSLASVQRVEAAQPTTLEVGDLLGVVELVRGGRWRRHASALSACEVLTLDPEEVARLRRSHADFAAALGGLAERRYIGSLLAGNKLFGTLDAGRRDALAARFTVRFLQEGEVLIEKGATADGLFLVAEGRLEVKRDGVHLGGLSPGDCAGLVGALDEAPASARVVAAPVAEVFHLPDPALRALLADRQLRAAFERSANMRRLLVSRG